MTVWLALTWDPPMSVWTQPGCMAKQRIPSGSRSVAIQRLTMFRAHWGGTSNHHEAQCYTHPTVEKFNTSPQQLTQHLGRPVGEPFGTFALSPQLSSTEPSWEEILITAALWMLMLPEPPAPPLDAAAFSRGRKAWDQREDTNIYLTYFIIKIIFDTETQHMYRYKVIGRQPLKRSLPESNIHYTVWKQTVSVALCRQNFIISEIRAELSIQTFLKIKYNINKIFIVFQATLKLYSEALRLQLLHLFDLTFIDDCWTNAAAASDQ